MRSRYKKIGCLKVSFRYVVLVLSVLSFLGMHHNIMCVGVSLVHIDPNASLRFICEFWRLGGSVCPKYG